MINRDLEPELLRLNKEFAIVVLTGPRQSGKTTLCKHSFPSYAYFNLEDISLREQIAKDTKYFLLEYAKNGIVLDEVQKMPSLFSYIQVVSDEKPELKFILTGSNNFSLLHSITQSLAGRAALLTLLPLSLHELHEFDLTSTNELLFKGGLPSIWGNGKKESDVSSMYYSTYIERDVRQLINVKDISKFQVFIRLCAGRVGSEFNAVSLSSEVGVSSPTIAEWLSILEASYIVFRLKPFYKNIGKRLVKSPKIYFYDTAILCFLLGIENSQQLNTHPLRGLIFENLAVLEFVKRCTNTGKIPNIYFYRDQAKHEVDIVEDFGTFYNAYEIKSAKSYHSDFFNNLEYLKKILNEQLQRQYLIYDGYVESKSTIISMLNVRNIW